MTNAPPHSNKQLPHGPPMMTNRPAGGVGYGVGQIPSQQMPPQMHNPHVQRAGLMNGGGSGGTNGSGGNGTSASSSRTASPLPAASQQLKLQQQPSIPGPMSNRGPNYQGANNQLQQPQQPMLFNQQAMNSPMASRLDSNSNFTPLKASTPQEQMRPQPSQPLNVSSAAQQVLPPPSSQPLPVNALSQGVQNMNLSRGVAPPPMNGNYQYNSQQAPQQPSTGPPQLSAAAATTTTTTTYSPLNSRYPPMAQQHQPNYPPPPPLSAAGTGVTGYGQQGVFTATQNQMPMQYQSQQPVMNQQHQQQQQQQQGYGSNQYQQQQGQFNNGSVVQSGFSRLWGHETVDLMQNRHILPTDKVQPPPIKLNNQFYESVNCSPE